MEGGWTAVPRTFLTAHAELDITATQAMLVLQIMAYKWDERLPFPSISKIAKHLGIGVSQVRAHLQRLEKAGLLKRRYRKGRSTEYDFSELLRKLELIQLKRKTEEEHPNLEDFPKLL